MSRKQTNFGREILPDPKFGEEQIARFINMVMMSGKKSVAEKIIYGAIDVMKERGEESPLESISEAIDNVAPMVEVKSRRVGGATYQVPVEVRPKRRETLAMRWIIDAARKRGDKNMPLKLAGELMDAKEQRGAAVRKREEVHRMAEANKAFSHYRW